MITVEFREHEDLGRAEQVPGEHGGLGDWLSSKSREHSPYNRGRTYCIRSCWRLRGRNMVRSSSLEASSSAMEDPDPRSPFWSQGSPEKSKPNTEETPSKSKIHEKARELDDESKN